MNNQRTLMSLFHFSTNIEQPQLIKSVVGLYMELYLVWYSNVIKSHVYLMPLFTDTVYHFRYR